MAVRMSQALKDKLAKHIFDNMGRYIEMDLSGDTFDAPTMDIVATYTRDDDAIVTLYANKTALSKRCRRRTR